MVDSSNLKEVILSMDNTVELADWDRNIIEMTIEMHYGEELNGNIVLSNYPQLKFITFNDFSLQNVKSMKICDNPKLEEICIGYSAFGNTFRCDFISK